MLHKNVEIHSKQMRITGNQTQGAFLALLLDMINLVGSYGIHIRIKTNLE